MHQHSLAFSDWGHSLVPGVAGQEPCGTGEVRALARPLSGLRQLCFESVALPEPSPAVVLSLVFQQLLLSATIFYMPLSG